MTLRWTRLALADLESARLYLAEEHAHAAAKKLVKRIEAATNLLKTHSHIGRRGRIPGTREFYLPGTPFVIAYRLKPKQVEILSIIHGARVWPDQIPD